MHREKCERKGHRWVAWSPGDDPWCARLFCKAKAQAPVMALVTSATSALAMRRDGADEG